MCWWAASRHGKMAFNMFGPVNCFSDWRQDAEVGFEGDMPATTANAFTRFVFCAYWMEAVKARM